MQYKLFECSKHGESLENNEDSLFVKKLNDSSLLVNVSDGASTGVFSREWSKHLTSNLDSAWLESKDSFLFGLDTLRESFKPEISRNSALRKFLLQGSFATLMSIRISESGFIFPELLLDSYAIGDVCLFIYDSQGNSEFVFPYQTAGDFNNVPDLIRSSKKLQLDTPVTLHQKKISFDNKNLLVIATDALSEFLYKKIDSGDSFEFIQKILQCNNQADFEKLINLFRFEFGMKNDDVAICFIQYKNNLFFKNPD